MMMMMMINDDDDDDDDNDDDDDDYDDDDDDDDKKGTIRQLHISTGRRASITVLKSQRVVMITSPRRFRKRRGHNSLGYAGTYG